MLHCSKADYTDGITPERTAAMPSTTVIFDSYVLKCWAETARQQTLALEALAAYLDPQPLAPQFAPRLDDHLD